MKYLLTIAIAIFGLAKVTFGQTIPSYVPTNGLVGWWPFNENANDESGNNNNGVVNGATLTEDRFGNLNKAYSFDGTSNSIGVNHQPIFNMGNSYTISAWFNLIDFSTVRTIINKNITGDGKNDYFNLSVLNNSGILYLQFGNGVSVDTIGTTFSVPLNAWHNAQMVMGDSVSLYLNGMLIGKKIRSIDPIENTHPVSIGRWLNQDIFFNGKLDDIGIWNRSLAQQEIVALYNNCQLTVNSQPNSQQININNNAEFTVSSSDPQATYQWQTDLGIGFQNLNSVGQYSGTTNDTLNVANVTLSNNNQQFRCIIGFGSCSDTSNVAVLTVINNVGINELKQDNLFSVFPKPAYSHINVKADATLLGSVYAVHDKTGKVVFSGKINSESLVIDLGNLSSGIYLLSVGEKLNQSFKIIKE
jgi:hypothetical protein